VSIGGFGFAGPLDESGAESARKHEPVIGPRLLPPGSLDEYAPAWEQEGFALADGYDEASAKYRALVLPTDGVTVAVTDATLIVRPQQAKEQRASELPAHDAPAVPGPEPGPAAEPDRGPQPPGRTRFFGSKRLQADRYASDFKKLADEILGPLGATPGVTLNVTIEIEATAPEGFDDAKVRTVSENASTLKLEQSGFEEG
jgi:hypothetical protein